MDLRCSETLSPSDHSLSPAASIGRTSNNGVISAADGTDSKNVELPLPATSSSNPVLPNTSSPIPFSNNFDYVYTGGEHDDYVPVSPLSRSPSPAGKRIRRSISATIRLLRKSGNIGHHFLRHMHLKKDIDTYPLAILGARDIDHAVRIRDHMEGTNVTPAIRTQAMDWFTKNCEERSLSFALVSMSMNLFDRFTICRAFSVNMVPLLMAACFLISCKSAYDRSMSAKSIARKAGVPFNHLLSMEGIVVNILEWRVNIVTSHEVVAELNAIDKSLRTSSDTERGMSADYNRYLRLQESLLMHAVGDTRLSYMRATSIGVACFLISKAYYQNESVIDGTSYFRSFDLYEIASQCELDMPQIDFCLARFTCLLPLTIEQIIEYVQSDCSSSD